MAVSLCGATNSMRERPYVERSSAMVPHFWGTNVPLGGSSGSVLSGADRAPTSSNGAFRMPTRSMRAAHASLISSKKSRNLGPFGAVEARDRHSELRFGAPRRLDSTRPTPCKEWPDSERVGRRVYIFGRARLGGSAKVTRPDMTTAGAASSRALQGGRARPDEPSVDNPLDDPTHSRKDWPFGARDAPEDTRGCSAPRCSDSPLSSSI